MSLKSLSFSNICLWLISGFNLISDRFLLYKQEKTDPLPTGHLLSTIVHICFATTETLTDRAGSHVFIRSAFQVLLLLLLLLLHDEANRLSVGDVRTQRVASTGNMVSGPG